VERRRKELTSKRVHDRMDQEFTQNLEYDTNNNSRGEIEACVKAPSRL